MGVRTEPVTVKKKRGPRCPVHDVPMAYDAENVRWKCTDLKCRQIAWPENDADNGRPVVGRGDLEVVLIDDPEGGKEGRVLIRAMQNNVMVDITDCLVTSGTTPGTIELGLRVYHTADRRTRR